MQPDLRHTGNLNSRVLPDLSISAGRSHLFVVREHTPSCKCFMLCAWTSRLAFPFLKTDRPSGIWLITMFYETFVLNMFCHPVQHLIHVFVSWMQNCPKLPACEGKASSSQRLPVSAPCLGWQISSVSLVSVPKMDSWISFRCSFAWTIFTFMKRTSFKYSWTCKTIAS